MKDIVKMGMEILPAVSLAVFGGLTRTLVGKNLKERYNWRIGITEMVIAGFAGVVLHLLMSEYNISEGYKSAAIALSGYSAREVLGLLRTGLLKKISGGK